MRALQCLFAQMSASNQAFVDPSPLLRKLLDKDGKPVTIGNQEDIGGARPQCVCVSCICVSVSVCVVNVSWCVSVVCVCAMTINVRWKAGGAERVPTCQST